MYVVVQDLQIVGGIGGDARAAHVVDGVVLDDDVIVRNTIVVEIDPDAVAVERRIARRGTGQRLCQRVVTRSSDQRKGRARSSVMGRPAGSILRDLVELILDPPIDPLGLLMLERRIDLSSRLMPKR
jgi:hypothetical protein